MCKTLSRTIGFCLLTSTILFARCDSRELVKKDFISWVRDYDNGLHVKKDVGAFSFDLQYEPPAYVSLKNQTVDAEINLHSVKAAQTPDFQYYQLSIGMKDGQQGFMDDGVGSMQEKQQKLYYFSYKFENDIYLEDLGKKYPCLLFHFERSTDIKHSSTFLLAFKNSSTTSKEAKLIIQSSWFGSLPIAITVSKDKIPDLKI